MEFFKKHWKIISCGIFIGIVATLLQKFGNPANMGICVACFERDIAGALGFHRAAIVQYIRPEILAFVLGSFASSLIFKEFKPRLGSAPIVRFVLGAFAMIGALAFLGCPWRAALRLAGGQSLAEACEELCEEDRQLMPSESWTATGGSAEIRHWKEEEGLRGRYEATFRHGDQFSPDRPLDFRLWASSIGGISIVEDD